MNTSLTVIIPTFNEENYIEQALTCSRFADEILVIDSFSTDQTVELVRGSNARLLQRKFDNFSNQKNYAISQAQNDWILILDADEYLPYDLQKQIYDTLSKNPAHVAYSIPVKNYFINRFIHHGSNGNKKKVRLFNRKFCSYKGLVHERLFYNGSKGTIHFPILHYTYKNLNHFFKKKNHYSDLQAQQILDKNRPVNAFHLIGKPLYRFLNEYILRFGFLDGVAGLTSTTMNGYGVLSRYVKARQKRKKWNLPALQNFEENSMVLMEKAQAKGLSQNKLTPIYFTDFYLKPLAVFLNYYFLRKNIRYGMEGYILSYQAAFNEYNSILYHWLNKRSLD